MKKLQQSYEQPKRRCAISPHALPAVVAFAATSIAPAVAFTAIAIAIGTVLPFVAIFIATVVALTVLLQLEAEVAELRLRPSIEDVTLLQTQMQELQVHLR